MSDLPASQAVEPANTLTLVSTPISEPGSAQGKVEVPIDTSEPIETAPKPTIPPTPTVPEVNTFSPSMDLKDVKTDPIDLEKVADAIISAHNRNDDISLQSQDILIRQQYRATVSAIKYSNATLNSKSESVNAGPENYSCIDHIFEGKHEALSSYARAKYESRQGRHARVGGGGGGEPPRVDILEAFCVAKFGTITPEDEKKYNYATAEILKTHRIAKMGCRLLKFVGMLDDVLTDTETVRLRSLIANERFAYDPLDYFDCFFSNNSWIGLKKIVWHMARMIAPPEQYHAYVMVKRIAKVNKKIGNLSEKVNRVAMSKPNLDELETAYGLGSDHTGMDVMRQLIFLIITDLLLRFVVALSML